MKEAALETLSKIDLTKIHDQVLAMGNTTPEKAAATIGLAVANIYAALLTSRSLEGTVYSKHEKALAVAGLIGVTAINGLINYNIWS